MMKVYWMVASFVVSLAFWAIITGQLWLVTLVFAGVLVHEFGHYWAARQIGLSVELPVFSPFGAAVRLNGLPKNAAEEAFLALCGPAAGGIAGGALACAGCLVSSSLLAQAAQYTFVLNLVNLIPLSPMDGGRIAMAIERRLWLGGLLLVAALLYCSSGGLLVSLLVSVTLLQAFRDRAWRELLFEQVPEYFQVPLHIRAAFAVCYLALAAILATAIVY